MLLLDLIPFLSSPMTFGFESNLVISWLIGIYHLLNKVFSNITHTQMEERGIQIRLMASNRWI